MQDDLTAVLPNRKRRGRRRVPEFLAVDFYCGAGGTTRGLIDAGGYVIAGLDKEKSCRETYVANNGNETGDRSYPCFLALDLLPATPDYPDGQQSDAMSCLDDLIFDHRARYPDTPLLFAICAPCQPFTKLSKTARSRLPPAAAQLRDRGLLSQTCRFVERFKPDMVLSENVPGIDNVRYGGIWKDFADRLAGLGYQVETGRVCTSDFGIPQYRKRSILAAIRMHPDRMHDSFSLPLKDDSAGTRTVADALQGLPPLEAGQKHGEILNHVARNLSELNRKRISYAKPGESNIYLENTPEGDLSLTCHKRVNSRHKNRCFADVYTRMAPDRPAPTITTRCHSITNGRFGHPCQDRAISMREAARLQSFKDSYIFYPFDKLTPVAQMIGNAVPPALAHFYAGWLVESFKSMRCRAS
ncbi:MAG: DNA cytosine methyltransferase [Gammaproteobacteria bacterium]|nr:DNA cytosine methyltransferase [Gammaproteobacteria bacterium]